MWYGEMCVHLYDLLDVLAAKATATTKATSTTAAAKKTKEGARVDDCALFCFFVAAVAFAPVASVSVPCDQDDQVVPAHQVDDIEEIHELDPVHQVDHKDQCTSHHIS